MDVCEEGDGLTIAVYQEGCDSKRYFRVLQYSSQVLLLLVMRVMGRKISWFVLELMLFYAVVRNMDIIKYYCPYRWGH